jgi:hypothetical protein
MMITPADSAPQPPPGQMPAAPGAGPAPVPFSGDQSAANAPRAAASLEFRMPGPDVLAGVTGADHVSESPLAAPNVNPYEAGQLSPIFVGGDPDAGGRDDVAGSVAEAVANAQARYGEHQRDTFAQGSQIGDSMDLPAKTSDGSAGGGFYDPPRDY